MWGGKLKVDTPMLYAMGFIALFLIGGLDGAFLAVVPFDFHVQDTYWVVSHLHYVLVAGSVFGIFAALFYWFPKMTGRLLNERLGKIQWVLLFVGTNLAFFPQHLLGLDGMIRRIVDYAPNPGWTELNFLSTIGAFMIGLSMLPFLWNVFATLRWPRTAPDDPWDGYTLEWATTSPPPPYNFDVLPPDSLRASALRPQARCGRGPWRGTPRGRRHDPRRDARRRPRGIAGRADRGPLPRRPTPVTSSRASPRSRRTPCHTPIALRPNRANSTPSRSRRARSDRRQPGRRSAARRGGRARGHSRRA